MRLAALLCAALAAALPAAAQQLYYRSNEAGMLLERIPSWRRDEYDLVAGEIDEGPSRVRVLYEKGKEARRWVTRMLPGGAGKEEREIVEGETVVRRLFDAGGALLVEETWKGGAPFEKSSLTWESGRLARVSTTGPDGAPRHEEEFLYARDGRLREVRRLSAGGQEAASRFVTGAEGLAEERHAAGNSLFLTRYDAEGRVLARERRVDGRVVSREEFAFEAGSRTPVSSKLSLPDEGRTASRQYDTKGLLSLETVRGPGSSLERTEYRRDGEDRLVSRRRIGSAGLEEWS